MWSSVLLFADGFLRSKLWSSLPSLLSLFDICSWAQRDCHCAAMKAEKDRLFVKVT